MNYETTKHILEKLKPYVDIENLDISTESTGWKGRKYKADYIKIDEKHNVGFEVTDRSIIVFYFSDHSHFDNYTSDENDIDYIGWAMEFLENLFTLPIRHVEKYKGKKRQAKNIILSKMIRKSLLAGLYVLVCLAIRLQKNA